MWIGQDMIFWPAFMYIEYLPAPQMVQTELNRSKRPHKKKRGRKLIRRCISHHWNRYRSIDYMYIGYWLSIWIRKKKKNNRIMNFDLLGNRSLCDQWSALIRCSDTAVLIQAGFAVHRWYGVRIVALAKPCVRPSHAGSSFSFFDVMMIDCAGD